MALCKAACTLFDSVAESRKQFALLYSSLFTSVISHYNSLIGTLNRRGAKNPVAVSGSLRTFHKLLEISQKAARNFSKSCSKVAQKSQKLLFVHVRNESFPSFIWSDAKICKLYNKSKISKQKMCE